MFSRCCSAGRCRFLRDRIRYTGTPDRVSAPHWMNRFRLRVALGILATCAGVAHSQVTPARTGAILSGATVDSIRGGYLKGASIFVSGTALSATTDSTGRFKLSGIPAGSRFIEVQHPLLDSLGLTLVTPAQNFADSDSSFVLISVPSARTYAASTCTAEQRNQGPGVIAGSVTDADGVTPSQGATVRSQHVPGRAAQPGAWRNRWLGH